MLDLITTSGLEVTKQVRKYAQMIWLQHQVYTVVIRKKGQDMQDELNLDCVLIPQLFTHSSLGEAAHIYLNQHPLCNTCVRTVCWQSTDECKWTRTANIYILNERYTVTQLINRCRRTERSEDGREKEQSKDADSGTFRKCWHCYWLQISSNCQLWYIHMWKTNWIPINQSLQEGREGGRENRKIKKQP